MSKSLLGTSSVALWVKDLTQSRPWLGSVLWHGFDPWPQNLHMLQAQPKKSILNSKENLWFSVGLGILFDQSVKVTA